jgi:phosphoribosylanthranilate isomerase
MKENTTVHLKICGLQPGDDVSFAQNAAVSHVGFIFVPQSRRYISPLLAARFVEEVKEFAVPVGVFSNALIEDIVVHLNESGIRTVQLHGQETPEMCQQLRNMGYVVWKAISVHPEDSVETLQVQFNHYLGSVDALLLDAKAPKSATVTGGHGIPFDWNVLSHLSKSIIEDTGTTVPIWIAGGVHASNVRHLLGVFVPFGVDVSSSVEVNGRKSSERILELIEAVAHHA